jgi:Mg2+/Co2+ transporter CorC
MRNIRVKEVMIPISDYVTVKKNNNLTDVLLAIEQKRKAGQGHAHRDAIVVDEDGHFIGKVTMIDIFRALEPNYRRVRREQKKQTLTDDFVRKAVKEFKLWMEPIKDVCHAFERAPAALPSGSSLSGDYNVFLP